MKTKIILATLLLSLPAFGQLLSINTTNRTTNTVTSQAYQTAPGFYTNLLTTSVNSNNVIVGDTLPDAFYKVGYNFNYLKTSVRTNGGTNGQIPVINPAVSGGFMWTNASSGSGTDTNKVPIYNGGATNLTVTNTFKLTSTTPYYTVASVTFTNGSWGDTNRDGTYYPSDGTYGPGSLTNGNGEVIFITDIYSNLQTRVSSIWVTNGVGAGYYYPISKAYAVFTNITGSPTSTNFITQSGTSLVVITNAGIASANQVYATNNVPFANYYKGISDPNWQLHVSFVSPSYWWYLQNSSDSKFYYAISNGPTANLPVGQWTTNVSAVTSSQGYTGDASPAPQSSVLTNQTYQIVVGLTYFWATYSTNAWRFYSSSDATFVPDSETIIVTSYTNSFYVTNVPYVPPSSLTYTANNGNPVIFNTTNDYALTFNEPSIFFFGSIPGAGGIAFVSAGTNNTTTLTDWANQSGGSSSGGFYNYIGNNDCGSLGPNSTEGTWKFIQLGNPRTYGIYCNDGSMKIIPETRGQ